MDSIMNKFFRSSMVTSVFLIVLGGLLIFESEATIVSISYIIGGILTALGLVAFIRFVGNTNRSELDIIYGIVTITLGVLIILHPKALASIIPIALGICIVITSSTKLQYALELKDDKNDLWVATLIVAILSTICGLTLIFNPFKGAQMITQLVGGFILVYAILDIISTLTIRRNVKVIKKAIKTTVTPEAIIKEEKYISSSEGRDE